MFKDRACGHIKGPWSVEDQVGDWGSSSHALGLLGSLIMGATGGGRMEGGLWGGGSSGQTGDSARLGPGFGWWAGWRVEPASSGVDAAWRAEVAGGEMGSGHTSLSSLACWVSRGRCQVAGGGPLPPSSFSALVPWPFTSGPRWPCLSGKPGLLALPGLSAPLTVEP